MRRERAEGDQRAERRRGSREIVRGKDKGKVEEEREEKDEGGDKGLREGEGRGEMGVSVRDDR